MHFLNSVLSVMKLTQITDWNFEKCALKETDFTSDIITNIQCIKSVTGTLLLQYINILKM